jgi:hypothetical protein
VAVGVAVTVSLEGLHPTLMRPRVEAVLADPAAQGLGLYVVSAFRSVAKQQQLWNDALRKYKDPEIADNWVARPGTSNHGPKVDGYGVAVDFGLPGVKAVSGQWPDVKKRAVDGICARHGLRSPMAWEDWHFEPIPNWPAAAPQMPPTPPPLLLLEVSDMKFRDENDEVAWQVVYAYTTLLGRVPESLAVLAERMGQVRALGYAHVWNDVAASDEGRVYLARGVA